MRNVWWWMPTRHRFRRCLKSWVCPNTLVHTLIRKLLCYQPGQMEGSLKADSTGKCTHTAGLASENNSVIFLLNTSVVEICSSFAPCSLQHIKVWIATKVMARMPLNELFKCKLSSLRSTWVLQRLSAPIAERYRAGNPALPKFFQIFLVANTLYFKCQIKIA